MRCKVNSNKHLKRKLAKRSNVPIGYRGYKLVWMRSSSYPEIYWSKRFSTECIEEE